MSDTVKVAAVQMDVKLADPNENLRRIEARLREAAQAGARLVVFPECALTGYCYETREEAFDQSVPIDSLFTQHIGEVCAELQTWSIFGLLEREGEKMFNALALLGPNGLAGSYRKIHLPKLGVDNFVDRGDRPFKVWDAAGLKVGPQICYDCSFPEPTRVMALDGAELVVLPTNWPPGAGYTADYVPNCRALENHVYFLVANRVGEERGFQFIGKSKICEPNGSNLAFAEHDREEIIYADIDPEVARNKHLVRVPGKHEIDRFRDRHPESYHRISEK